MADAASPPYCDLVLEGGVTSALIYTGLIATLSGHYRFKRLGGTSSGAVAAAAGAIAQRAELNALALPPDQRGGRAPGTAFSQLRRLPILLARLDDRGRTALLRLFQPQAATARGFALVLAMVQSQPGSRWRAAARGVGAAVLQFPLATAAGALPGLWLIAGAVHLWPFGGTASLFSLTDLATLVLGVIVLLVLGTAVPLLWALWVTLDGLRRNHFGLCSGMAGAAGGDDQPLTSMLHELFNGLLGRTPEQPPVTFGDLWGDSASGEGPREIDLQVITTALNQRRPYRIPNDPGVDPLPGFYYDPADWELLFPPAVTTWFARWRALGASARPGDHGTLLWPLPPPHAWPVLWAVRLSLSFPGLLSAIPMYCWERPRSAPRAVARSVHHGSSSDDVTLVARKVYFSDGGITSNCPVQLFDAPLPGHPTFGVRLDTLLTGEGGRHRVWLPTDAAAPVPLARPFGQGDRVAEVGGFVASILRTALDWRDSLQRSLPGYRERIVVVGLKPDEGGLNLAMTPRTIGRLAALGSRAARRLLQAYASPQADGSGQAWNLHRWVRLRSTLAAAQQFAAAIAAGNPPATLPYDELLALQPSIEPIFADAVATAQAASLLDGLAALAASSPGLPQRDLGDNAPQPAPRLRMSAPW